MSPEKEPIIYITRDIDRVLGMTPSAVFRVISNRTAYGETMALKFPKYVTLLDMEGEDSASTGELVRNEKTKEVIDGVEKEYGKKPRLLIFKNTARIEPLIIERGWTLLNPPLAISERIEQKISQISWLGELGNKYLPPHKIDLMKNVKFEGKPFIVQWAHGHTGGGTLLISNESDLEAPKTKFPERLCRISDYIVGPSFTVNVVATKDKIHVSSPSYQITGLAPFTDGKFSTIGNDWGLATKILSDKDKAAINIMAEEIGTKMQRDSWRGLFGIDLVKDSSTGKLYLIEINARQPASTVFESQLQEAERDQGAIGLTTFEAHISALLEKPITKPLIEITDGAQIVQRVTRSVKEVPSATVKALIADQFSCLTYENTSPNADLLRIQSAASIMSGHEEWNALGKKILMALSQAQK